MFWTVASKKQEKTIIGFCPSRKTQYSCESLAITVGDNLEGLTVEKKEGLHDTSPRYLTVMFARWVREKA